MIWEKVNALAWVPWPPTFWLWGGTDVAWPVAALTRPCLRSHGTPGSLSLWSFDYSRHFSASGQGRPRDESGCISPSAPLPLGGVPQGMCFQVPQEVPWGGLSPSGKLLTNAFLMGLPPFLPFLSPFPAASLCFPGTHTQLSYRSTHFTTCTQLLVSDPKQDSNIWQLPFSVSVATSVKQA